MQRQLGLAFQFVSGLLFSHSVSPLSHSSGKTVVLYKSKEGTPPESSPMGGAVEAFAYYSGSS